MRQSSKRLFSLVVVVLFLFAAFLIYFNAVQPAYEKVQAAKSDVYSKKNFIETQEAIVGQAKQALAEYKSKEELQKTVSMAIPPGSNQSEVAHQISVLAAQSQLAVQSLAGSTPTIQAAKEDEDDSGGFRVRPLGVLNLQIRVAGTYANFKSFISSLENNIRILDVKSFSVEELGKPNQDFYVFNISVATYYQNP